MCQTPCTEGKLCYVHEYVKRKNADSKGAEPRLGGRPRTQVTCAVTSRGIGAQGA